MKLNNEKDPPVQDNDSNELSPISDDVNDENNDQFSSHLSDENDKQAAEEALSADLLSDNEDNSDQSEAESAYIEPREFYEEVDIFEKIDADIKRLTTPVRAKNKEGFHRLKTSSDQASESVFKFSEKSGTLKSSTIISKDKEVPPPLSSLRFKTYNLYDALKKRNFNYYKKLNLSKAITFSFFENSYVGISDIGGAILISNYLNNRLDTLVTKIETNGYPTAIEFSIDHMYIYIGHSMGDIKVIDTEALTEVQAIAKVIMNPISGIKSLTPTSFIAYDTVGNVYLFEMRRNYLFMMNIHSERIDFFNNCTIGSFELATILLTDIQSDESKSDLLALITLSNKSSVSIFQFEPQRKNIEFISIRDDQKLISAHFNAKKYSAKKRIFFSVLTSSSLYLYELRKTVQRNGTSVYNSELLHEVNVLEYNSVLGNWLNDNTFALFTKNCKEIFLFNFLKISLSEYPELADKDRLGGQLDAASKNRELATKNMEVYSRFAVNKKLTTDTTITDGTGPAKDNKLTVDALLKQSKYKQPFQKVEQLAPLSSEPTSKGRNQTKDIFFEKDILPETVKFEMADMMISMKYLIKANERSLNPSKVNFLDFRGTILEIELRKWRDYFDSEFELNDIKIVLGSFLQVYKGEYSFFNDFIFDQFRRERIMNSYLSDKLTVIFDRNFSLVEDNINHIVETLIAVDNYDFLFDYLKREFIKRGKEDVFDATIEYFIEHNRIHRMPNQQILDLSTRLLQKNKGHLITSFILNLDLYNEKIDNLRTFCLANELYVAAIFLYMNINPPAISELITTLLQKTISKQSNRDAIKSPTDQQQSVIANEMTNAGIILIWFVYKFVRGQLFGRQIENWLVEAFIPDIFHIFSKPETIIAVFSVSWKNALLLYEQIFDKRVLDFLRSQMLTDNPRIEHLIDSIYENAKACSDDVRAFIRFYLHLKLTTQFDTPINDFAPWIEQFVKFTQQSRLTFCEFLLLIKSFVLKFRDAIPTEQLSYLLNQLWENFRTNPTSKDFVCVVIDIHIELGDERRAFEMIALSPIRLVKAFVFNYIVRKIQEHNEIIKHQFLADFKYFFIISTTKTFEILRLFKPNDIPVDYLLEELGNYPTLKFQLEQFLLETFPELYKNKQLVMSFFELVVAKKDEILVQKFLVDHFESIELVRALKVLLKQHMYYPVAILFRRTGNPEKAFTFYFLELKRRHKNPSMTKEDVADIIHHLNDLVDEYPNILQGLSIRQADGQNWEPAEIHQNLSKNDSFGDLSIDKIEEQLEKKVINNISEAIYERESIIFVNKGSSPMSMSDGVNKFDGFDKLKVRGSYDPNRSDSPLHKSAFERSSDKNHDGIDRKLGSAKRKKSFDNEIDEKRLNTSIKENPYSSEIISNSKPNLYYSQRKFDNFPAKDDTPLGSSTPIQFHRQDLDFHKIKDKIDLVARQSFKKKIALKDSLDFDRTTDAISINDIIGYCNDRTHLECNSFKSKCLLSFLNSKNITDLTGLIDENSSLNVELVANIFKEINARAAHFDSILTIINTDYHNEKLGSANGNHFSKRCSICNEQFIVNLSEDLLVIAKPKCGHIFHIECYQKQKITSQEATASDKFKVCPVCENIKFMLLEKNSSSSNIVFQDPIIKNLISVVNPLSSVFKTTSYGLKKIMDTVVTFGTHQEEVAIVPTSSTKTIEESTIISKRESLTMKESPLKRRMSIGKTEGGDKSNFSEWLAQFKHDEVASRFERIKNDAEFDISLAVNDKRLK